MKLYILESIEPTDYDEYEGMVIRATSELRAREMAAAEHLSIADRWLSSERSSCKELVSDGDEAIIITDFRYG